VAETKKFQKNTEDFNCENCGAEVQGDGYTNHCNICLYSKHVDVNPGDRAANCGGVMEPTSVENENGEYVLTHTCKKCGHKKRNKVSAKDDFDKVVELAAKLAEKDVKGGPVRARLGAGQMLESLQPLKPNLQQ
jgi:ribosomal protein L32